MPSLSEQVCEGILRSKRQKELAIVAKEERTRWEHITNIESAKRKNSFWKLSFVESEMVAHYKSISRNRICAGQKTFEIECLFCSD